MKDYKWFIQNVQRNVERLEKDISEEAEHIKAQTEELSQNLDSDPQVVEAAECVRNMTDEILEQKGRLSQGNQDMKKTSKMKEKQLNIKGVKAICTDVQIYLKQITRIVQEKIESLPGDIREKLKSVMSAFQRLIARMWKLIFWILLLHEVETLLLSFLVEDIHLCRKKGRLKYGFKMAAVLALWLSHDVESNPGPPFDNRDCAEKIVRLLSLSLRRELKTSGSLWSKQVAKKAQTAGYPTYLHWNNPSGKNKGTTHQLLIRAKTLGRLLRKRKCLQRELADITENLESEENKARLRVYFELEYFKEATEVLLKEKQFSAQQNADISHFAERLQRKCSPVSGNRPAVHSNNFASLTDQCEVVLTSADQVQSPADLNRSAAEDNQPVEEITELSNATESPAAATVSQPENDVVDDQQLVSVVSSMEEDFAYINLLNILNLENIEQFLQHDNLLCPNAAENRPNEVLSTVSFPDFERMPVDNNHPNVQTYHDTDRTPEIGNASTNKTNKETETTNIVNEGELDASFNQSWSNDEAETEVECCSQTSMTGSEPDLLSPTVSGSKGEDGTKGQITSLVIHVNGDHNKNNTNINRNEKEDIGQDATSKDLSVCSRTLETSAVEDIREKHTLLDMMTEFHTEGSFIQCSERNNEHSSRVGNAGNSTFVLDTVGTSTDYIGRQRNDNTLLLENNNEAIATAESSKGRSDMIKSENAEQYTGNVTTVQNTEAEIADGRLHTLQNSMNESSDLYDGYDTESQDTSSEKNIIEDTDDERLNVESNVSEVNTVDCSSSEDNTVDHVTTSTDEIGSDADRLWRHFKQQKWPQVENTIQEMFMKFLVDTANDNCTPQKRKRRKPCTVTQNDETSDAVLETTSDDSGGKRRRLEASQRNNIP